MAKVKLGSQEFDVDCEEIRATNSAVSDEECVALGARIPESVLLGAESLHSYNKISVSGVCRIVSCIVHNENLTAVQFVLQAYQTLPSSSQ